MSKKLFAALSMSILLAACQGSVTSDEATMDDTSVDAAMDAMVDTSSVATETTSSVASEAAQASVAADAAAAVKAE